MYHFAKNNRLLTKHDYNHVFNQAKKIVTPDFTILYRGNLVGHARLGLALSKKVIVKAHDRNRIKRLLRETFRVHNLPAVDIIVLARTNILKTTNPLIIRGLNKVWDKLCDG